MPNPKSGRAVERISLHQIRMPLPIETPAPKASSLIKRFQQNIDQSDEKPVPPVPKQRLSIGPDDPAYRRRSWAVGSGGAALPQTEVLWRGRQPSSGSASGYIESLKIGEDTEERQEEITYQSDQVDIELITHESSSTEEGSRNTDEPIRPIPTEAQPNQMISNEDEPVSSVQIPQDESIHIAAESSTGSISESVGEKEGKKRSSKRRSGIAAW
ncbi:uncharacterized protein MELLADRAFT_117207 [Melampsora larici-populina 98AG31]|uniref:Uncharacterized protein n=1 Tax=Melampsora larici-populina (strain 98AG31 / pathotype 3-4-7) TaxID=747676 RepID=F4RUP8_MELLP|nr:uncharacterized protein MELLADRAFT_117207 [Melampsora larici-populina 98AG31]EGG03732.1 hypothetical protein MELLADRAFT_117207 [Melampsora larici-populina 98AG31]